MIHLLKTKLQISNVLTSVLLITIVLLELLKGVIEHITHIKSCFRAMRAAYNDQEIDYTKVLKLTMLKNK